MTVKMGAPMPPNPMMPRQPMNPLPPPMPVPPINPNMQFGQQPVGAFFEVKSTNQEELSLSPIPGVVEVEEM